MKPAFQHLACTLFLALLASGGLFGQSDPNQDLENIISHADLVYTKPASRSEEGMPLGNGRTGSLIWTTPHALHLQVNRVDIFAHNSDTDNFYERHTDFCGGAGFVDIDFFDFSDGVFNGGSFHQRLSCFDGLIYTDGEGVKTRALAWHDKDVIAIEVNDQRSIPSAITASLRMLRNPVAKKGDHNAVSELIIDGDKITLKQEFREDNYFCSSAVQIAFSNRQAKARLKNESEVQLSAKPGKGRFYMYISSAASFDPDEDVVAVAAEQLDAAIDSGFDGLMSSNQTWWYDFWQKGYINLSSADGEADFIEQNYTYFLYVMASSSRGKLPPKFNGMLWNTGGDSRKWGSLYWGANQSCLYNGLFPTNRMDLLDPMFDMYSVNYASFEKAARQQWRSQGIYIPETVGFDGLPELPENIALEMQELYLLEKNWEARSDSFKTYAQTKLPFLSRWNWKVDGGWRDGKWLISDKNAGPFGHVNHIFSRGAKIAYQYWMRYEYTRDENWLRERAYPMLKGMAEFYRNYPHVKKGPDGKYHIYHINDNEALWNGHNTIEEISSMKGIFPAAIRASEILGADKELRPIWKEFLENLSGLPTNADTRTPAQPVTWVKSLEPVSHGSASSRPDPNTMPVWFFDLCNPGSGAEMLETANATFDSYFSNGINRDTRVNVLSKLPVAGTILGREEAARYLIPNQIRTAETEVLANRMDLREGYQTASVQRLGRMADALHNALFQTAPGYPGEDPVIRLFPAWPSNWDADFRLLSRGAFVVSASRHSGVVGKIGIVSQVGSDCAIVNPWKGNTVILSENTGRIKRLRGDVLKFKTVKGGSYTLAPVDE